MAFLFYSRDLLYVLILHESTNQSHPQILLHDHLFLMRHKQIFYSLLIIAKELISKPFLLSLKEQAEYV